MVVGLRSGVTLTNQVISPSDHTPTLETASERWMLLDSYDLSDEEYREVGASSVH